MATLSAVVSGKAKRWGTTHYLLVFAATAILLLIISAQITGNYNFNGHTRAVQSAVVSLATVALTVPVLYQAKNKYGFLPPWMAFTLAYNAFIVVIKLIISPAALSFSGGQVTSRYISAGIVVMVLYLLAVSAVYEIYRRKTQDALHSHKRTVQLNWLIKLGLATGIFGLAIFSRVIVAHILTNTSASNYLDKVFSSNGLLLPILLASMIVMAIESFELAAQTAVRLKNSTSLKQSYILGAGLIVIYHLLWVIYTVLIFKWA